MKFTKRNDIRKWLLGVHTAWYAGFLFVILVAVTAALIGQFGQENPGSEEHSSGPGFDVSSNSSSGAVFIPENHTYQIQINKEKNYIDIVRMDKDGEFSLPVQSFICSVHPSVPTGKFAIQAKFAWRKISDSVFGRYTSQISGSIYLHSVPYYTQTSTSLNRAAYAGLGKAASIGSVYMNSYAAKWIYENCGNATEVIIYEDGAKEPLCKTQDIMPLPEGALFDPTDTDLANYCVDGKINYMQGVHNVSLPAGSTFDKWDGIFAVDMEGNNITSHIFISGDVNVNVPGTYKLIYNLYDNQGTFLAYHRLITIY